MSIYNTDPIEYRYNFRFINGDEKKFLIRLDNESLDLMDDDEESKDKIYPKWAKLKNFMCPNCTLNKKVHKYCPVAVSIDNIIEDFSEYFSYEMVDVVIETEARSYFKYTSLHEAINSLIGVFMVASGCPVLEKLKPMIRVHLPFSTLRERKYRVLTMYLFAQYFLYKRGETPDWDFENLVAIFKEVRIVNKNFCNKLSEIKVKDATINALISLDSFAYYTSFFITENMLSALEPSFNGYIK